MSQWDRIYTMKKFLILSALIAIGGTTMLAQNNIINNPNNKPFFGLRLGGEITCPGDFKTDGFNFDFFKVGGGVELGGIYNIPIVANFYLEPGMKFFYNTYSFKDEWLDELDYQSFKSISIKKSGMRIPVMAGYHFDFTNDVKAFIFTGPELEIGFSAREVQKARNIKHSNNLYGEDGDMNRIDLLWSVGAGFAYQHFNFSVSGNFGMLNMLSDSPDVKFNENRVTFSLGYNF